MDKSYIVSDYLGYSDTTDEFDELDRKYEMMNHNIPEKDELLKYADD